MRVLPRLVLVAALVAAAVFLANRPGSVSLAWQGWRVDTSLGVLAAAVVLLGVVAAALFHLLRRILGGSGAFRRRRRERRRRNGYRALTRGMVAVAAGDAEEAQKFARKADVLLAEPPLTLLLSAQAAQMQGDEQAAKRYFTAMLDRPETEFLGLRGLIMQALRRGDEATALRLAERARELRPRTPWVLSSLYELQARGGRWSEAEATLAEAAKRKALPAPAGRHHRAVLLLEKSRTAGAEGSEREAMRLAAKAHGLDPGFAPAAMHYARLLATAGRRRHAGRALERAWRAAPQPALAREYGALATDEAPLARVKHFERLAALVPDHPEGRLALADAALKARLWGEARRQLDAVLAAPGRQPPGPRACRLMAELEEAEHGDQGAARAWLARAAASPNPDPAWVCGACGGEAPDWAPLCPRCRAFASLEWRVPGGVPAAPLPGGATDLAPALPVPAPWPRSAPAEAAAGIDAPATRL